MKYLTPPLFIFLQLFISVAQSTDNFDDATCDSVCTQLVDTTNAKEIGITGADSWTSSDDAWCAANPYSSSTPPTTTTLATQQNRCQYHDTQVLTYCVAYEKIHAAQGMETPLMVLDVAGAALCGTACAMGVTPGNAPLFAACRIDSTAASAMDVYDALVLQSDPTARALTGLMGAAGLGVNAVTYAGAYDNGLKNFFSGGEASHDKRNACITAGVLAAGAGMRAWDLTHQQQSKESACNDVKNLLSNSPVIGVTNTSSTTSVAQAGSSGSTNSGTGATRTGSSISGSGLGTLAQQMACVSQSGAGSCGFGNQGQSSAATDGGLLSSSGLDKTVAQQLGSNLPAVSSAPNAGAMVAAAMGDAGGDIGTKIADIAKTAQQDGQKLAKAAGTYSGGTAVASAPKTPPGFGGFNFDSGATGEKKDEVKYDRAIASVPDGDIWHEGYKGSIFQIISSKIVESKPRVDNLDWSTPLNRALMGLPSQKAAGGLK